MSNKNDKSFEQDNFELDNFREGFTINAIDELLEKTAHADGKTRRIDFSNDDLWLKDLGDDDNIEFDLEKYRENYLPDEKIIVKDEEQTDLSFDKFDYISPFEPEKEEKVSHLDKDRAKKLKIKRREEKSNTNSSPTPKIKARKYSDTLLDVMNPDNDVLMKKTKSTTYDIKASTKTENLVNENQVSTLKNAQLEYETSITARKFEVPDQNALNEMDFEDEQEQVIEPLKSHVGDVVNNQSENNDKSTRFINQATIKTAHFDAINKPENFENSSSKFIKKPENYVNPFEKKAFDFAEFDDEDDFESLPNADIQPPVANQIIESNDEIIDEDSQKTKHININQQEQEIQTTSEFVDLDHEEVEKIDESVAEKELLKRRKHKVNQFKLKEEVCLIDDEEKPRKKRVNRNNNSNNGFDITTIKTSLINLISNGAKSEKDEFIEFNGKKQACEIRSFINSKRTSLFINTFLLIILTFVSLLLAVGVQVGNLPDFVDPLINPKTLIGSNLVLVLLSAFVARNDIINGVKNLTKMRFGKDGVLTITVILAILQNLCLFPNEKFTFETFTTSYSAIAVVGLLFSSISNFLKYTRIGYNFSFLNSKRANYSVSMMESENDILQFSRGAEIADTNLAYSCKADFCTNFMKSSNSKSFVDKTYSSILPLIWIATALVFVITLITQNNFDEALAGALALSCVTSPASIIIADNYFLNKVSKTLRYNHSMISGIKAIEQFSKTNAIVIDAKDLFPKGTTKVCGMKIFNNMRIDEAILYTSNILTLSNAPLASAFEDLIDMKTSIVDDIETITYEGNLGISAWIGPNRVLVGTREMMEHHNIVMPPLAIEKKYIQNDSTRRILYLSVDSKVSALFTVSYLGNNDIIDHLTQLEDNAISILVRTVDANIDEKLISEFFEVSENCIKILTPTSGDIYKKKYSKDKKLAQSLLLHKGKANSFVYLINSCVKFKEKLKVISILQWLSVIIGFLLVSFFSIFTGMEQTGVLQILIYQLFWIVVTIIMSSSNND